MTIRAFPVCTDVGIAGEDTLEFKNDSDRISERTHSDHLWSIHTMQSEPTQL